MGSLTDNFDISEMLVSESYPELIEEAQNSHPTNFEEDTLKLLCQSILQPVRNKFGAIKITSALRPSKLNAKVGGAVTSDHIFGAAADIIPFRGDLKKIFRWIKDNVPAYRQLILYKKSRFIHCSINHLGADYKHEHFTLDK